MSKPNNKPKPKPKSEAKPTPPPILELKTYGKDGPQIYPHVYIDAPKYAGRPTAYRDDFPEKIVEIAKTGCPYNFINSCCVELGIHRGTFWLWAKDNKKFFDAVQTGKEIWEQRLDRLANNPESKMDFRYYRSYIWRVKQEKIEPDEEKKVTHRVEPIDNIILALEEDGMSS